MKKRVRIDALPKASSGTQVGRGLKSGLGLNSKMTPWSMTEGRMSQPDVKVNSTLQPVPKEFANLEAEEGEVAMVPGQGGVPSTFKIGGNKHTSGGTPLNLPSDSFIYSDTKNMKIKDEDILAQFGITSKGAYTPADIAKKYDINKYKKVLADPDTDKLQRDTAEGMIANYNLKLAKLALLQESMKGFPQGIPMVAMPYVESMEINPSDFIQMNPQGGENIQPNGNMNYGGVISKLKSLKTGGTIDYFQDGGTKIIAQPKRTDRVVLNSQTGEYEVINAFGKKIGVLNVPQPKNTTVTTIPSTQTTKKTNIPEDAIIIKRSDYKTEEEYIAARNNAFTTNSGKPVYTQSAEGGNYSKVIQQPGTNMPVSQHIKLIGTNFSEPAMQQALYDKTLASLNNPNNVGRKMGFTKDELIAMGPEGLANNFIEMQTRNLESNQLLSQSGVSYDCFDNTTGKLKSTANCKNSPYKSLDELHAQTSVGVPKDKSTVGIQQASYIGYRDLLSDNKSGKIKDPTVSGLLQPFRIQQRGVQDESGVDPEKDISKIDTFYTNTTTGQIAGLVPQAEYSEEGIPEDVIAPGSPVTKAEHLPPGSPPELGAPWWLQDIIKTGHAAGNLARIKKYNPWQATPDVVTPEVTFYDPTRELAANAEQSNIAAQTLAQFTGPQSFNARNAQIQGQSLKNAADIMSRYNNQNVTVSNQQAAQNASVMNQASQQKAQLATNLYDKYQTVNQQFDNAKNEARDALVNQYVSAITNKNYTANLNKMYPQFAVDPSIGGEYYFHDPRALKPDFSQSPDIGKVYESVLEEHPTLKDNPALAYKMAAQIMGIPTQDNEWLNYQQNKGVIPQYPQE